jgi:isopropylmalate/homocitrate/citramalate synthase
MSETFERIVNGEIPVDFNWQKDKSPLTPLRRKIQSEPTSRQAGRVQIVAEDLRDGLHGVSEYPFAGQMIEYVGALQKLGIKDMTVGIYPGDGNKIDQTIRDLLGRMRDQYPDVTPIVLTQATEKALKWLGDCKEINPKLNAIVFMGSAPSRMMVEDWSKEFVLGQMKWAVDFAANELGVNVIGATEHTTQTPPDFLRDIIRTQVDSGAKLFCIADTVGIARPQGAARVVSYVRNVLDDMGAKYVSIDWHGHMDTGNGLQNAMAAVAAGANRIHTVARGIGERAGNTPMESVLQNLSTIIREGGGKEPWNMKELTGVLNLYNKLVNVPTPQHGPLADRAFQTTVGIHARAMEKGKKLVQEAIDAGRNDLAEKLEGMVRTVYTAVDPQSIGSENQVGVGPWSGASNVRLAWQRLGGDVTGLNAETTQRILDTAKNCGHELTDAELRGLIDSHV